ncbi:hypothetical protein V8C35DRAFT_301512 [Trichoderma chlorosporum]
MVKRKAEAVDPPLTRKRIKSDSGATLDGRRSKTRTHAPTPPSLTAPKQSRKRKQPEDSQTNPSEAPKAKRAKKFDVRKLQRGTSRHSPHPSEAPKAKRAKKFDVRKLRRVTPQRYAPYPSSESDAETECEDVFEEPVENFSELADEPWPSVRDSKEPVQSPVWEWGSEPWPSIHDFPEEPEDPVIASYRQLFRRSRYASQVLDRELANRNQQRPPTNRRGPLPSPVPSDGGAGGSHPTATHQTQPSHTTPEPVESQPMPAAHTTSHETDTSNSPPEQHRKNRRQRRRSRSDYRGRSPPPSVEDLWQSKRASRRNPECVLWRLDDKGTARLAL